MKHLLALASALLCALLASAQPANSETLTVADSVQTYSTLTDTTVTMSGRSELHITGTSNPIAGSTIHLNSNDSWLWLDNVRPNTVNSTYLSQIRVDGAPAVHGGNVRVVQYGMGTVVIPFTNAEQPLETFTDPGFSGASRSFRLYTYYDSAGDLGVMHRNISSFKLKRGFMATFATEANGSGTSKVYIAQDHDVHIGNLPGNLDNAVQFVRVFPWRWVSKKGSCDVSADTLNAAWFYNWNNDRNSTLNWEYVPIRQQRWWPAYPENKTSVTHLSGFNEPDNPVEDAYQTLGSGSRDAAIAAWPELLSTGLRVGSPAVTDGGKWWLYDFMDKANAAGLRVDYITIHFYQCGQSAADLKAWLQEIWDRYRKPIWLTEFNNGANWTNCGDPTYSQNASVINSWIDMMDSTPWIERYAVYSNVEATRNMVYNEGSLTPAGVAYRDQKSPIGYLQEDYPLAVKRRVVRLPLDGHTRDVSGYDNGGVSYGAPTYVAGQRGQALQFNGSNFHVKLPPAAVNSNSFTFAGWVNWDGGSENQRIFDFGNGTSQYFFLTPDTGGKMRVGIRNGSSTTSYVETNALPSGSWQHIVVTMQGTTAKIYLNGVQQASGTISAPSLTGTMLNYLGKSQWSSDPLFKGRLDEVVMADAAWTQEQIAAVMAGSPTLFQVSWKGDVDGVWSTSNAGDTNWLDGEENVDAGAVPVASTNVIFAGAGASRVSNTILGADFSIGGLTVTTSSAVGIGGSHDLTIGANGINVMDVAGATTINTSGQVRLGADQAWTNNSPNTLTVSSAVSGSGTLTLGGAGIVALNGANTFTGEISVLGGGSVSATSIANSLGSASGIRMGGGGSTGTLIYTGAGEVTDRVLTFQGGYGTPGATIDHSGSGLLKFTANLASIASVSKTLTLQGSTGGAGEFAGIISNGGSTTSLAKTGTGKWTLSGANTYTGRTTLNEGTLAIGHNAAFGTSTVDLRGATLQSSDATPRAIGNAISFSADTTFGGAGNLLFTGAVNAGSLAKSFIVTNPRTEFRGVISGGGARIKSGPGTLIFSGANTYTGATTVSDGTLVVDGSLAAASAVTVTSGAALAGIGTVGGPATFADGSRFKWMLSANSVPAGKLSTASVNIASGAAVDLVFNGPGSTVDFTEAFWTQSRAWTALGSSGMTGRFTLGSVSTDSGGRPIDTYGSFHLQQTSAGVKVIFAPLGLEPPPTPTNLVTTVSPGAVGLTWDAALGADSYNVLRSTTSGGPYETIATDVTGNSYSDASVANGLTYYYVIEASNPGGASQPTAETVATPHLPSTTAKAENTASLSQPESWVGDIVPAAFDTANWSGLSEGNSSLLGANASWNGISVGATGGPVSIGGGGNLTLGTGGIDMSGATQDLTIASGLALRAGHQIWTVPAGRTLTLLTGAFSRFPGATLNLATSGVVAASMQGIANEGSTAILGPWATVGSGSSSNYARLSGSNLVAYTAGTNVSAAALPNPGTTNDNYNLITAATTSYGAASRNANTIRNAAGASTLTFGNSSSQINLVANGIMNAGTGLLTVTNGGTNVNSGIMVGPNNGRELVVLAASNSISLGRILDNPGGVSSLVVYASGSNSVTLTGANTFTGDTYLNGGTLLAGNNSALGAGTLHLNGGTLGTTAALTIPNPMNVTGTNVLSHAGQTNTFTLSGSIAGAGTLKNGLVAAADANLFFNGDLGGFAGTLDYTGQAGNTTHRWRVGASGATVDLSRASLILRIGDITDPYAFGKNFGFRDGIENAVLKLGALSGDGVFQASYNNSGPNTLEVGHLNRSTTFSGVLAGGIAGTKLNLTKVGTGTLTLSGVSPYTGATTINGGILQVNGALTGTSSLAVHSGGTLAGIGTISGAVSVRSAAVLAPGEANGGVLTLSGTLTLTNGSVLEIGLGSTSSRIALGGAFSAEGTTAVNIKALEGFGPGTYPLITGATGIDAANFQVGAAPAGYTYGFSASGGTLSLTVIIPLTAPAGLTATGGGLEIGLEWAAASAATSYNIKRSTTSGSGYVTVASGITKTSYSDTELLAGTTYFYVVSAVNSEGESDDSEEVGATVLSPIEAWRKQQFGTTENTNEAADLADFDKDGLFNLLEYALGLKANEPSSVPTPLVNVVDGRLTISFTRNTEATDVVLIVWGTDDLASGEWEELARSAGGAPFITEIDGNPTGASVQERGSGPMRSVEIGDIYQMNDPAHPKRFLELEVQR